MKKKVCIIYTGGTIGMAKSVYGYEPRKNFIQSALNDIEALEPRIMPDFHLIEYDPLQDSSNITVKEWTMIAEDIEKRYNDYDGFVILHGTDTMAYTASALSFMLDGLDKPVIFTGSQIPLCEIRNDARSNLITALIIAGYYNIPEVCLYFGGKLMRGNRTKKVDSENLMAFESPNYPDLANVGIRINVNERNIRKNENQLTLTKFGQHRIAVLKIFPGIQFEVFESILNADLKGIVFESFGAGNMPDNQGNLAKILEKALKKEIIIVVCTQCLRGSAILGQYATSHGFTKVGAISGYDMTVEAAVTKLYYLLSLGHDVETTKKLMGTNLRGELTLS